MEFSIFDVFFSNDKSQRRVAQKGLFMKMPIRPIFKLIYMLIIKLSILDGRAGVTYAILHAFYEFMIDLKVRELSAKSSTEKTQQLPMPSAIVHSLNYSPEAVGIGKYNTELAEFLVDEGIDVYVVTAFPYYPAWKISSEYNRYFTQRNFEWRGFTGAQFLCRVSPPRLKGFCT